MSKKYFFDEKVFDRVFYDFDVNFYKNIYKDITHLSNTNAKIHYVRSGKFEKRIYNSKIKILIVCDPWNDNGQFTSGGNKALYNLGKQINEKKYKNIYAKMYDLSGKNILNPYCNFFANKYEINNRTLLIYPDGNEGNPLNAKNVVRWILLEIGTNYRDANFYKSWNPGDLVYHWEFGKKQKDKVKILNNCIIDPIYINKNNERINNSSCYLIKKRSFIEKEIVYCHPNDSICLDLLIKKNEIVEKFNICEYFYCYDLKTFFFIGALLCGCKVILIPDNRSKRQFILESIFTNFLKAENMFAWGIDDIININYTNEDIKDLKTYLDSLSNSVDNFLDDIFILFNSQKNLHIPTVKSVYIDN